MVAIAYFLFIYFFVGIQVDNVSPIIAKENELSSIFRTLPNRIMLWVGRPNIDDLGLGRKS